jgi:hypothetical protein
MHSPAQAILWQISWRNRWVLSVSGAYFLLAIFLSHVLPANLYLQFGEDGGSVILGFFLGIPFCWMITLLAATFSLSGTEVKESGFTPQMRVLPVRTSTLVAWPMMGGCLAVMVAWWVAASLVFRPAGAPAPLWWPGAALALCSALFQAVSWTPFAQRWLQTVVTVSVFMALFFLGMLLAIALEVAPSANLHLTEPLIAAAMIAPIPLLYVVALSGVAKARRGEAYDWGLWNRLVEWAAVRRPAAMHPFSSAARAQLWFECRAFAWTFPVFIGILLFGYAIALFIEPADVALSWKILGVWLGAPLLVGAMVGDALGKLHDPWSKPESAAFILTRPIPTISLIQCKLVAAALATAATWALVLGFLSLLLLRPGFYESVAEVARSVPIWQAVALPILTLVMLATCTWISMIANLWIPLTGRSWVASTNTIAFLSLLFCGSGVGLWLYLHPGFHALAWTAAQWITGLLLLSKFMAAAIVIRSLNRSRLMSGPAALALVCGWSLLVAGLYLIAACLTPSEFWSAGGVLTAVVLSSPLSRLAGASLALEWNRHR